MIAGSGGGERPLLVVALGQRLEAVERGLEETETALRRLAHNVPPEGKIWLARAQEGLARAREAVDGLTGRSPQHGNVQGQPEHHRQPQPAPQER